MMAESLNGDDAWFDGRASAFALTRHNDSRGALTPLALAQLPFPVRRVFTVAGVPAGAVRGGHGHQRGWQLLVCVSGTLDVRLYCAGQAVRRRLSARGPALLIGAGVWAEQTYVDAHTVLLVACSEDYDPSTYMDEKVAPA